MEYDIRPFVGIGELKFGETREALRERLGATVKPFLKCKTGPLVDAYDSFGLHLYFDSQDRLEFIETFVPAMTTFAEIHLLGLEVEEANRLLSEIGCSGEPIDVGYQYDNEGFCLYAPLSIVLAVSAFRRGYYDD